ncbi:hypothetical protein J4232_02670 [Candidatus Woesearchaeota archaeon]|nr:hypothetical protein [Candidatus Woesearchaeota archaeon]
MDEQSIKLHKYMSLIFLVVTFSLAIVIYLIIYIHRDVTSKNALIFWIVENHSSILIGLILFSGFIGYISSALTYKIIINTKKESRKLLKMLFLFLSNDEKNIINCLVDNKGTIGQADISRLPNMDRVKAFRSLRKMQAKNLIDIVVHGKIRKISLKDNILNMLTKD